jgi:hypothetical protein
MSGGAGWSELELVTSLIMPGAASTVEPGRRREGEFFHIRGDTSSRLPRSATSAGQLNGCT